MISFAVMHYPHCEKRKLWLEEILKKVPSATVIADSDKNGIWHTASLAWNSFTQLPYHMVLQDDFELCDGFVEKMSEAIEKSESMAVSGFAPCCPLQGVMPWIYNIALKGNVKLIDTMPGAIQWGGTVALGRSLAAGFVEWANGNAIQYTKADDELLALYLSVHKVKCKHTVPELMKHVGYDSSVSEHNCSHDWRRGAMFIDDLARV